jgi:hypothetical protein
MWISTRASLEMPAELAPAGDSIAGAPAKESVKLLEGYARAVVSVSMPWVALDRCSELAIWAVHGLGGLRCWRIMPGGHTGAVVVVIIGMLWVALALDHCSSALLLLFLSFFRYSLLP